VEETFVTLVVISLWAFVLGTGAFVGEKYWEDK
jgi:hypothetical protein